MRLFILTTFFTLVACQTAPAVHGPTGTISTLADTQPVGVEKKPQKLKNSTPRTPPALLDENSDTLNARAWLAHYGTVQLTPNGPWFGPSQKDEAEVEFTAVRETPDAVQVLSENSGYRLLLWVPKEDFEPRLNSRTALFLSNDTSQPLPKERGVELAGGLDVHVVSETKDALLIEYSKNNAFHVAGWIPRTQHTVVYKHEPLATYNSYTKSISLLYAVTIRAEPDGEAIARLNKDVWGSLRQISTTDNHVEIEFLAQDVRIRGFVPKNATAESFGGGGRSVCGSRCGLVTHATSSNSVHIPLGTQLFSNTGKGAVIGITTRSLHVPVRDKRPGWIAIHAQSSWGSIPVWVRVDAL